MPNTSTILRLFQFYQFFDLIVRASPFSNLPLLNNWVPLTPNFMNEYQQYPMTQRFVINCLTQLIGANSSLEIPVGFVPLYPAVVSTLDSDLPAPLKAAFIVSLGFGQLFLTTVGSPQVNSLAGAASAALAKQLVETFPAGGAQFQLNFKPQFTLPASNYIRFGWSSNHHFI
jgi:hypothetical protein